MYNSALLNDRYYIVKQIGSGGMSSVYLCIDKHINKKWAIKVIKGGNGLKNSEVDLLKSLDYYLFPRIVDAFEHDGNLCIVTDLVEGENLSSYLKQNGALPVNVALKYFKELIDALNYLHSLSPPILYLDMKPSNIMIRPDGQIRLIDFGIAGSILLKSKSYGSIGYSPPEQYKMNEALSDKTDVFALAMTLSELLTGVRPHRDISCQVKLIRKSKDIPKFIKNIILISISENQNDRPSLNELRQMMSKKQKTDKGVVSVIAVACVVCILFACILNFSLKYYSKNNRSKYREEMINKASLYIEDGEYTAKGLKIICGYIDGNFLDEETKNQFTYEVAKNYFEVQKDYASAKVYFSRLDETLFPDVKEYKILCDKMRRFDEEDYKSLLLYEIE